MAGDHPDPDYVAINALFESEVESSEAMDVGSPQTRSRMRLLERGLQVAFALLAAVCIGSHLRYNQLFKSIQNECYGRYESTFSSLRT